MSGVSKHLRDAGPMLDILSQGHFVNKLVKKGRRFMVSDKQRPIHLCRCFMAFRPA